MGIFIYFFLGGGGGGLIFVPGIFSSFDFCPHSIIPVIWNPKPHPHLGILLAEGNSRMYGTIIFSGGGRGWRGSFKYPLHDPYSWLCCYYNCRCCFLFCFVITFFAVHISNVCGWPGYGPWWLRHCRIKVLVLSPWRFLCSKLEVVLLFLMVTPR